MLRESKQRGLILGFCLSCLLLALGCSKPAEKELVKTETDNVVTTAKKTKEDVENVIEETIKTTGTATLAAQLAAQLAAADGLDGESDKTIHKCAGCALAMDGKADHSLNFADYTMHFCSEFCQQNFSKETETKVLALSIP